MAVARFEGTPCTPTFARIAVAAAASAEMNANVDQVIAPMMNRALADVDTRLAVTRGQRLLLQQ
ncbi:MAG: hypothetical protein ACJ8F1_13065 [Polyangia bacterium]|jgi:hypothetical protein